MALPLRRARSPFESTSFGLAHAVVIVSEPRAIVVVASELCRAHRGA